jgi:hypothetical protein
MVEKRRYMPGYYFNKNESTSKILNKKDSITVNTNNDFVIINYEEDFLAIQEIADNQLRIKNPSVINTSLQNSTLGISTHKEEPIIKEPTIVYNPSNKKTLRNKVIDERKIDIVSLFSFITGVFSLFVLLIPFVGIISIPFGLLTFVLGIIGLRRINKNSERLMGKGFAIAGFVIGSLFILFLLLLILIIAAYWVG